MKSVRRFLRWGAAGAVALVCSGVALSQPPTPGRGNSVQAEKGRAEKKEGETQGKPTVAGRLPPSVPIDSSAAEPHTDAPKNFARKSDYQAAISNFSSAAIVFLTLGLLIVGILQWLTYKRQADYMREGLDANKIAADAAMKSADTARAALVIGSRAWIAFDKIDPPTIEAGSQRFGVSIVNKGRVPAMNVCSLCRIFYVPMPVIEIGQERFRHLFMDEVIPRDEQDTSRLPPSDLEAIVAPGALHTWQPATELTEDNASAVRAGKVIVAFRAIILYSDCFMTRGRTETCLFYDTLLGSWICATKHNRMD